MAKAQCWTITLEGVTHCLKYTRSAFSRHVVLEIDGERFELPKGEREEPFRLGDEQAILCIRRDGSAAIRMREGELQEDVH